MGGVVAAIGLQVRSTFGSSSLMPKDAGSEFSVFLARFCECSYCALQFPFCFLKLFEDLFLYLASPDSDT